MRPGGRIAWSLQEGKFAAGLLKGEAFEEARTGGKQRKCVMPETVPLCAPDGNSQSGPQPVAGMGHGSTILL